MEEPERPSRRASASQRGPARGAFGHTVELVEQAAALRHENDARNRGEKRTRFARYQVGPQHEDATGRRVVGRLRPRLARAHHGFERYLEILDVGGLSFVQDHEIDGELLHPPVLVRLKQFARDVYVLHVADPEQDDRQIAGNGLCPQAGLPAGATPDRIGRWTQDGRCIKRMPCKSLEQRSLAGRDAEVVELNLRLRPGERRSASESGRVTVLVGAVEDGLPRGRDDRPKSDPRGGARRNSNAATQGEYRVEHRADGVREGAAVDRRDRRVNTVSASEETRPVGLDLRLADSIAIDDGKMRGPDSGSSGVRLRRVARMAPTLGRYSVSTNSFENAGCATSAACGARTSSA